MSIEEEFENVMLNIEMQVVSVANKEPTLIDAQVERVYNALISKYKALLSGRDVKEVSFAPPLDNLYFVIGRICDFFTGDGELINEEGQTVNVDVEKVSYENMVVIFKRLRKSLNTWTKRGGSKGYIYYISQFIPLPSTHDDSQNPAIDAYMDTYEELHGKTKPA